MRIIVMSDLHFGVPETSMNDRAVRLRVIETIRSLQPIERIVLLGDVFDLNLARLGDAIDGRMVRGKKITGFRQFLRECLDGGIKGPQWIYIPGNHDYDTFDVPARLDGMSRRFIQKTDDKTMHWPPRSWNGGDMAPQEMRNNFEIQYPHRWEELGTKSILLTHGHYLDPSQTMGKKIEDLNRPEGIKADKFFTLCAQYQSLTRAISYQGETIRLFGDLYKLWNSASSLVKAIVRYGSVGLYRGKALDRHIQKAALAYVKHFGPVGRSPDETTTPDAMIFGHTHKEGMVYLDEHKTAKIGLKRGVLLVNDGGFIHDRSDGNTVGSLVEVDSTEGNCRIRLHVFERAGTSKIRSKIKEEQSIE
jgi:UDP-2,3-diacylglucosamine pyrophosphatase LpxH